MPFMALDTLAQIHRWFPEAKCYETQHMEHDRASRIGGLPR
jgi:hypothetical protein